MSYDFNFDLRKMPNSFFKELSLLTHRTQIHKKLGNVSRNMVEKFKINEILGIPVSDAITLVEDLIDMHVSNEAYHEEFESANDKALFLPHCSRKHMDSKCQANFDKKTSSYECQHCSKDCLVSKATKMAEEKDYDVYVLPGGSCVKNIVKNNDYEGVIGIACSEEIKVGVKKLEKIMPVKAVPLLTNGCSDTTFNLKTLENNM